MLLWHSFVSVGLVFFFQSIGSLFLVKTLVRLMAILKAQEVRTEKEHGLRTMKKFLSRFGLPVLGVKYTLIYRGHRIGW